MTDTFRSSNEQLSDNRKLDELLTALGIEPGLFWARVAVLKWLGSVEPTRLRVALQRIRTAGQNFDSTSVWMQKVAADALLPGRFPVPSEFPPSHETNKHIANEWADMATNGIVWLRNVRDGTSTPVEALQEMESNLKRIRALQSSAVKASDELVRRPTGQCSWGCYYSEDGRLVRDSACTVHGASSEQAGERPITPAAVDVRVSQSNEPRGLCPKGCGAYIYLGHPHMCSAETNSADEFHVLRILGNGQISAARARELLAELRAGQKPELLPFELSQDTKR